MPWNIGLSSSVARGPELHNQNQQLTQVENSFSKMTVGWSTIIYSLENSDGTFKQKNSPLKRKLYLPKKTWFLGFKGCIKKKSRWYCSWFRNPQATPKEEKCGIATSWLAKSLNHQQHGRWCQQEQSIGSAYANHPSLGEFHSCFTWIFRAVSQESTWENTWIGAVAFGCWTLRPSIQSGGTFMEAKCNVSR